MQLTAIIQQSPEAGARSHEGLAGDVITSNGADYDTAKAALEAQVPDGWRMLSIRRD